jgi:S-DNA-T family DNA segregation ATPase FtsK/SpoIIIE
MEAQMNLTKARMRLKALMNKDLNGAIQGWVLPEVDGLSDPADRDSVSNYKVPVEPTYIERVLNTYGIDATFEDYHIGSAVTTFVFKLPIGTRSQRIVRYRDDLARDLNAPTLRILTSVGASKIGLEIEHADKYAVCYKDLFKTLPEGMDLPIILGEDTYGKPLYADLADMPHLLIAGQTGSGKSVFINSIIATLISKKMPSQVKFMMIDPKQVEFVAYSDIPHLMEPIANNTEQARGLLDIAVDEMEERFTLFKKYKVKKLSEYQKSTGETLPHIVFIVDEFSDLMMMGNLKTKQEVESKIIRIAQKSRAVGIHMILATQKPLATIVTSLIKANMPARIAFCVATGVDSRVILDENGAENLTGNGDMLINAPSVSSEVIRIQAPWVPDEDIDYIVNR